MAKETTFPNGITLIEDETEEEINEWYRQNGNLRGYAIVNKPGDGPQSPSESPMPGERTEATDDLADSED